MKETAEQRAAWKALLTPHALSTYDIAEYLGVLAKAWKHEHPHDDEESATWEWLCSMETEGFCIHDKVTIHHHPELIAWLDSKSGISIGVYSRGTRIPFLFNPTRRQVRLLVESLGAGE